MANLFAPRSRLAAAISNVVRVQERARALADPDQPLYFKTDTHWNSAGALLGLDGALAAIGMPAVEFVSYQVVQSGVQTGDLANLAALYTLLPSDPEYTAANYAQLYGQDPRTVGVLGDSFSSYYMPYLSLRFANCWNNSFETDLYPWRADNPECDVMILQVTERNLDKVLELLKQF